tara:strand:- start:1441 stop:1794 length:354 start_codon:yes stop_codon:yes gene_type:complete
MGPYPASAGNPHGSENFGFASRFHARKPMECPMKPFYLLTLAALLAGCTTASQLEPIPGSLIYGGQPETRRTKAPIGSTATHRFRDQFGQEWQERYVIAPDRSLRLVDRQRIEYPLD